MALAVLLIGAVVVSIGLGLAYFPLCIIFPGVCLMVFALDMFRDVPTPKGDG